MIRSDDLRLLVPRVVVDEFERNRPRIEASMTDRIAGRFKDIRQDINEYGGAGYAAALNVLSGLAHEVPLIGAMTTRNFDDILALLRSGEQMEPSGREREGVLRRGLEKSAPFHRSKNSVADALIIELYATRAVASTASDVYGFITSNSDDFSLPKGDARLPHPDLAELFTATSHFGLGVDGFETVLRDEFGVEFDELLAESDFQEEPRRLDEILEAESEFFDRVWYHRSLQHEYTVEDDEGPDGLARLQAIAGPGRRRVEAKYTEPGQLGPYTDFELGMMNGKLSTLRWVLGSEWDFLDT